MGRYPIGARAMTSAERSERHRETTHRRRAAKETGQSVGRRLAVPHAEPEDIQLRTMEQMHLKRISDRFLELLEAEKRE